MLTELKELLDKKPAVNPNAPKKPGIIARLFQKREEVRETVSDTGAEIGRRIAPESKKQTDSANREAAEMIGAVEALAQERASRVQNQGLRRISEETGRYAAAGAYEIAEGAIGEGILKVAGVAIAFRKVPNPGGRLGDAITKQTTANVVRDLQARGFNRIRTEVLFTKGPLGLKNRYADVVAWNDVTGDIMIVNIGKMTKSAVPVIRERRALDDMIFSPTIKNFANAKIVFVEKGAAGLP